MACLLSRHNSSDSEIMHAMDDGKDYELNIFYYSCCIFGAVCNLASANILDLIHNRTGHCNKNMLVVCKIKNCYRS